MDTLIYATIILLFVLAIADLIVGVSNDAVNFLNSAIGSKVAPFRTIMIVASIGILFGAMSSAGMMEVARKGIFNPQYFYFIEILAIFLGVMLTDIILLDLFNTMALPTSTTVSIVFEILGASMAVSIMKVLRNNDPMNFLFNIDDPDQGIIGYMNWSKAGDIISGIFLSVFIAFLVGCLVMFISRWLISFRFETRRKVIGILWCGLAMTCMTYFLVFKGLKSTFTSVQIESTEFTDYIGLNGYTVSEDIAELPDDLHVQTKKGPVVFHKISDDGKDYYKGYFGNLSIKKYVDWVKEHFWIFVNSLMVFWSVVLSLLLLGKVNIYKFVVMFGTFCLAMAFAGNDLVNFIGIPVAGFQSFQFYQIAGNIDPDHYLMTALKFPTETPYAFLAGAGIIMIITLFFSKKARSVTETEVNLGRQTEMPERFSSNWLSRSIVYIFSRVGKFINSILPDFIKKSLQDNFAPNPDADKDQAFDLVRASANLTIASVLIAIATNMKLPLSTTYVSFMVAMGTSLADRAWGQESAVYRVAGVLNVIAGWLATAFIAFCVAGFFAFLLLEFRMSAVIGLVLLVLFIVIRSTRYHRHNEKKKLNQMEIIGPFTSYQQAQQVLNNNTSVIFNQVADIYTKAVTGLESENIKVINEGRQEYANMVSNHENLNDYMYTAIKENKLDEVGSLYFSFENYLEDLLASEKIILDKTQSHVRNSHKPLKKSQREEIDELSSEFTEFLKAMGKDLTDSNETDSDVDFKKMKKNIKKQAKKSLKTQVNRIKSNESGMKNTETFVNIVNEVKDLTSIAYDMYLFVKNPQSDEDTED